MCIIISTIIFQYSDTFRGSPQSILTNGIGHRLDHDHFHPLFFFTLHHSLIIRTFDAV